MSYTKIFAILPLIIVAMFLVSTVPVEASSPIRIPLKIGKNTVLQIRGLDAPHGVKDFKSFPGYETYVHSNCFHVHAEIKVLNSAGREISSKGVSIPVWCKGVSKYAKQVFDAAKAILGQVTSKVLPYDVLVPIMINPQIFQTVLNPCSGSTLFANNCVWVAS